MAEIETHVEIDDWYSGLNNSDRDRAFFAINRLEGLGHLAKMPFSKALGDGLFELRFSPATSANVSPIATARTEQLSY